MDERIEQKFELVHDRLDHLEHRAETLEDKLSDRAARRREWLVIWLFVAELFIGFGELFFLVARHA